MSKKRGKAGSKTKTEKKSGSPDIWLHDGIRKILLEPCRDHQLVPSWDEGISLWQQRDTGTPTMVLVMPRIRVGGSEADDEWRPALFEWLAEFCRGNRGASVRVEKDEGDEITLALDGLSGRRVLEAARDILQEAYPDYAIPSFVRIESLR